MQSRSQLESGSTLETTILVMPDPDFCRLVTELALTRPRPACYNTALFAVKKRFLFTAHPLADWPHRA